MKTLRERFEDKYIPEPNTGCWLWSGAYKLKSFSYGHMYFTPGRQMGAHRVSYLIHNGYLPEDMQVCHKCDTPECVNPDHLFLGTHSDNAKDKVNKGRQHRLMGEMSGRSKLTEDDVRKIRNSSLSQAALAKQYGVGPSTIWAIVNRKSWGHI